MLEDRKLDVSETEREEKPFFEGDEEFLRSLFRERDPVGDDMRPYFPTASSLRYSIYGKLVGADAEHRRRLSEDERRRLEDGTIELIETVTGSFGRLRERTLDCAREVVWVLSTSEDGIRSSSLDPEKKEKVIERKQKAEKYGCHLEYQDYMNGDIPKYTIPFTTFLHFGRHDYATWCLRENVDKKIVSYDRPLRVYVNACLDNAPHLAALIINRFRELSGLGWVTPTGKVYDVSTGPGVVKDRKDKLLFYVFSDKERDILLQAIGDIYGQDSSLVEPTTLPFTQSAIEGVPGVSMAEEPVRRKGQPLVSFSEVRAELLAEALASLADTNKWGESRLNIAAGYRDLYLERFRAKLKELAPKFDVDPEMPWRNLSSSHLANTVNEAG